MKITLKCGITKKIKNPYKLSDRGYRGHKGYDVTEIDKHLDELDRVIEGSCGVSDWSAYVDINWRTNKD